MLMLGYLVGPLLSLLGALPMADSSAYLGDGALPALMVTFFAATVATLLAGLLGLPLGLWLARTDSRLRHAVTVAVLIPLAIPPVVGGLSLLLWLGSQGWLGSWLERLGLMPVDRLAGTVLAQTFVASPYVILSARAAFSGVDRNLEDAARTLGCTPFQTLVRVTAPAARLGLATGLVLGWVRCLGEFGATAVVAYHPYTLPILTYVRLTGEGPLSWIPPVDAASRAQPIAVTARLTLDDFRLDVSFEAPARFVALLGPSGAGKSLTLKTIAGLLKPDSGRVSLGSHLLMDTAIGIDIPAEHRQIGYLAQGGALFEHLDVEANIGFALKRLPASRRKQRTEELIKSLGLERVRRAHPDTLSGGERQRVALARALVPGSSALLLDEPFASLDAPVRRELRDLLREVHDRTAIPVLLVTHDREDALDLADHVIVIDRGRVVQAGSVEEVFARPKTRAVARLLGIANLLTVRTIEAGPPGRIRARTDWGEILLDAPEEPNASSWSLAVPADAVQLEPNGVGCQIVSWRPSNHGWTARLQASTSGEPLEAFVPHARLEVWHSLNGNCRVEIDPSQCHLMTDDPPT